MKRTPAANAKPEKNLRASKKAVLKRPQRMVKMGVAVAEGAVSARRRDRVEDPRQTQTPVRVPTPASARPIVPARRAPAAAGAAAVAVTTTTVTAKERRAAAATTALADPDPKEIKSALGKRKETASNAPTAAAAEAKAVAEDRAQTPKEEVGERNELGITHVQK